MISINVDCSKNETNEEQLTQEYLTTREKEAIIGVCLDNIKQQKINEMNLACQNAIISTFQSTAFDGVTMEDYACELTDQSRINGLVAIAQLRLANLTTEPINYYKNKEAIKCTEWQPKNMLDLGLDLKRHIEKNTNHYEDLKIYINSLNSIEEVQKVTWDTVIPTTTT